MKIITIASKSFFLLSLCTLFFLPSDAQRREGGGRQNEHQDRAPHVNREPAVRPQPQRGNPGVTRNEQRPPTRITNGRPGPNNSQPVARNYNRPPNGSANYRNNSRYHYSSRPPVYNAHNPSWRYRALPRRNTIIRSFPFSYQTINFGGYGYRYYNGSYYRPYNGAYIVVAPPIGLFINVLPFGYSRIMVHDYPYYYYNGTYYDQYQNNYRVVAPPLGAIVESIPQGYETIVIDGETYYKVDNVQYKPIVQDNGEIWYEVIKVD